MKSKSKLTNSLIISISTLVLILFFTSKPFTWNLNKSIGWGYELWDYFGFGLILLLIFSVVKMLNTIDFKNVNRGNIINILINSISIFLIFRMVFSFVLLMKN